MASGRNKVFRTHPSSKASLLLKDNSVAMIGDSRHFIVCDDRGVTIKGPVSFVSDTMGRRTAGLFVGINDFFEMIPQTLVTPIPSKIPFPPVFAVQSLTLDLAFFMALLV
jgi:hypothetical protein